MSRMLDPVPAPGVAFLEEIPYGMGGGRLLHLDLARPLLPSPEPLPAVVFIHGGDWIRPGRGNGAALIKRLAGRGYVAASIDYRPSGEAGFPAQLEDCKCAVRFLRALAAEYGIDPRRIGVAGASAGGHLAALVGLTSDEPTLEGMGGWPKYSSRVSAVADLHGISDMTALAAEPATRDCALRLMCGTPAQKPALYRKASPLQWVRPGSPPFYLAHGKRDALIPPSHSETLAAALRSVGAEATLRLVPGMAHSEIASLPKLVLADLLAFFRKHLAPPPGRRRGPA